MSNDKKRQTVLYIEDDPQQRLDVARMFTNLGYECLVADTGEKGLSILSDRTIDLILCDLNMPEMSGLDVLDRVRELSPEIPFLILTAHGTASLAREAIRRGATSFLLKPFESDELDIVVQQAFEIVALRSRLASYSQDLEQRVRERTARVEFSNRQLMALSKLSNEITRINDENELLDKTPVFLTDTLDFDRAICFLVKNGDFEIRSLCFERDSAELTEMFKDRFRDPSVPRPPHMQECLETNRTVVIHDLNSDPRWPKEKGQIIRTKAVVFTPLRVKNKPIGVIAGNMQHHERDLDEQDVARFETFASMVGLAIENIRSYQHLEKQVSERTRVLSETNRKLDVKARQLESRTLELAQANVDLLSIQEELEEKNSEMQLLLDELSYKQNELRAIYDASPSAIAMVGRAGVVSTVNRRFVEFFGVAERDAVGKTFDTVLDILSERARDKRAFQLRVEEVLTDQDSCSDGSESWMDFEKKAVEFEVDGTRWIVFYCLPVHNSDGSEIGQAWIFVDVTKDRKAIEQVKLIVETSPTPTIVSSIEDGRVIYLNHHLANLVGYSTSEIKDRTTPEFYYDARDRKRLISRISEEGAVDNFQVRLKHRTGKIIWTSMSLALTELGGEKVLIGGITDITELKETQQELRKERNFVTAILDTAGALVIVLDPQGKILTFNRTCERISGYRADEVLGKGFQGIFIPSEEKEMLAERFAEIRRRKGYVSGENHWLTKDGERRLIAWSNTVILDSNGEVEYVVATGIDITERKQAEDKLRLYKEIFLNSRDSIVILDREGNFLESNPTHAAVTGYAPEEMREIGLQGIIGEEEFTRIRQAINSDTDSFRTELNATMKDGTEKTVDISGFPVYDEDRNLICFAGIGRDVTEQRRAQKSLSQRLEYEEGIASLSRSLLTGSNFNEAIDWALKDLLNATGVSRVYIFENFEDPDDGLCMRQTHEVCADGVEPQIDNPELLHFPYSPGFIRWKETLEQGEAIQGRVADFPKSERDLLEEQDIKSILGLPIVVGSKWYGFIGFDDCMEGDEFTSEDVRLLRTAAEMIGVYIGRKQFEEALRVSEERFRSLVEKATDVIYSMNANGEFNYISPQFTVATGFAPDDFIGRSVLELIHPEEREETERWIAEGMYHDHPHPTGTYPFRMRTKDGDWRWFTSATALLKDDDGRIIEAIGVAHDITEMKSLLEDLERTNRELREAQSQLVQSEKMASLGQLVAGIAHEINTPVGAVASMHNTLIRAISKLRDSLESEQPGLVDDNPQVKTALKAIEEANRVIKSGTERVTSIVRRLRSFARLDEAELKKVDIHEGIEDTLTLIHHEIKHHIKIERDFGEINPISVYPGRLNQVFLNIFNNARQAITGEGTISIRTYEKERKVYIEISDTGAGISSEHLSRVFDPGFTTKGVGVGTGLGLSICFQIVKEHFGDIRVESSPGKGTKFTVILPTNLDKLLEKRQHSKGADQSSEDRAV